MNEIKEAINWLKNEYPNGIGLVYVDYNDSFDEDIDGLASLIREGYLEEKDWIYYAKWDTVQMVIRQYSEHIDKELDDSVIKAIVDWCFENDTSDPETDLLKNTSKQLCYFETDIEYILPQENNGSYASINKVVKRFAKNEEQEKEIKFTLNESFYSSNISFYFYLDMLQLFEVLHGKNNTEPYIVIDGAYLSTITRGNGSNWLGEKNIFKIAVRREDFIKNFYLDEESGTGYGWQRIAGQTDYEEAGIYNNKTQPKGVIRLSPQTSESQKQEKVFAENWKKTGKCMIGDMNISRHKNTEYINDYPCGTKCKDCGTFWID